MKVITFYGEDGECLGSFRKPDDYTLQGTEELFAENSSALPDRDTLHKQSYLDAEKAQEYARKRKEEYDALNQLEMQYDDEVNDTTTWKDAIAAIKTKWPKDNSGPK